MAFSATNRVGVILAYPCCDAERAHIIRVLEATEWNKLEAAKVLEISRGTLYRKIDEYGLEPAAGSRRRGR